MSKKKDEKIKLTHKVKAYNRINSNIITMVAIYLVITLTCLIYLISNVTAESKKYLNNSVGIGFNLVKEFNNSFNAYYEDFKLFPIGRDSINESVDHYCAERHVNWGGESRSSSESAWYFTQYHVTPTSLANKLVKSASKKEGQIDTDCNFDEDGQLIIEDPNNPPFNGVADDSIIQLKWNDEKKDYEVVINPNYDPTILDGFRNVGTEGQAYEDGKITVHTNWVYRPIEFWFHSSYFDASGNIVDEEFDTDADEDYVKGHDIGPNGHGTSSYSDLAFAYVLATCKTKSNPHSPFSITHPQDSGSSANNDYQRDKMQIVVWNWLAYDDTAPNAGYKGAGKAFERYNEDSKDPHVTAYPDENVGTTINDDNSVYTVGPFEMENYVRAKSYGFTSEDFVFTETVTSLAPHTPGDESWSDTTAFSGSSKGNIQELFDDAETYYNEDFNEYIGKTKQKYQGDIIGMTAILTNEDGDEKEVEVTSVYIEGEGLVAVPEEVGKIRGKKFSIPLDANEVEGYDELKDIKFLYQRVGVRMDGKYYYGFQGVFDIDINDDGSEIDGCNTYLPNGPCNPPSSYVESYTANNRTVATYGEDAGGYHQSDPIHYHCGRHSTAVCGYEEHYHGDGTCNDNDCTHEHDASCSSSGVDANGNPKDLKNCTHPHNHSSSCYDSQGNRICGMESGKHYPEGECCDKPEHTHTEACYWHSQVMFASTKCSTAEECTHQYHFTCNGHQHEQCDATEYELTQEKISDLEDQNLIEDECQDGVAVTAELVPEQMEYIVHVNVPMKTKMLITKGIVKTFHPGEPNETQGTYENETERLLQFTTDTRHGHTGLFTTFDGYTMDYKRDNPIKVERGDYVWFKVIIGNESRFDTIVKIKDVIYKETGGQPYRLYEANDQGTIIYYEGGDVDSDLNAENEIIMSAYSQREFYAKVRPREPVGKYTNEVEFITRNHLDGNYTEHMKYVKWGEPPEGNASTYWMNESQRHNIYGNIVNLYANDLLNNAKDLEKDSDTYLIKEYAVNLEKYVAEVDHKNESAVTASELDTSFDGNANNGYVSTTPTRSYLLNHESVTSSAELEAHENYKESAPVYVEYGDDVTYYIDIYNTCKPFLTDEQRKGDPYYEPNKVYVYVEDTLPENVSDIRTKVTYINEDGSEQEAPTSDYGYEENGSKLIFKNVMVPAGGKSRIEVKVTLENQDRDTIQENHAKLDITKIRNINKGPGPDDIGNTSYTVTDFLDLVEEIANHYLIVESSDWTVFNEYHAIITKYLSDYIPVMTDFNNEKKFTEETNSYIDNLRKHIRYTYTEDEKKDHPLNAEKGDDVVFTVKVTNMSINEAVEGRNDYKDLYSPGKPNTQVRPSKIYDYAQEGLELDKYENQISAMIYKVNMDGTLVVDSEGNPVRADRYVGKDNIPVTVTDLGSVQREDGFGDTQTFKKYSLEISDDHILNPQECIIYTVKAFVNKSNMYLYTLENSAELGILTNINCDDDGGHTRIVKEDSDVPNGKNQNVAGKKVKHQNDPEKYYIGTDISRDYVKLKDLVIAGKVWIDNTADGLCAAPLDSSVATTVETDKMKPEVIVKLYSVVGNQATLYRETKTDGNGMYTFARMLDGATYYSSNDYNIEGTGSYTATGGQSQEPSGSSSNLKSIESRQRVPKTTPYVPMVEDGGTPDTANKDNNLNYNRNNPPYAKYFIEFEYDGLYYKATDLYAYDDNLAETGDKEAWNPLNYDTSSDPRKITRNDNLKYINDSNAYEFWDERKEFDSNYETIGYDVAYGGGDENSIGDEPTLDSNYGSRYDRAELLEYSKGLDPETGVEYTEDHFRAGDRDELLGANTAHISELLEEDDLKDNPDRIMRARSFIHGDPEYKDGTVNMDVSRDTQTDLGNTYIIDSQDFGNTKLLYLFDLSQDDYKLPETEYLKYINLGLVKREKVDLSLMKDVYQVKVTVNGEEIIYTFNQEGMPELTSGDDGVLQKLYQSALDYNIELYEDDYNYRYDNYTIQKVKDYKKAISEMNVEVTYKIVVKNNEVMDYDTNYSNPDEKDIPLYARINEIADYYDSNFIKYTDAAENFDKGNEYDHKVFSNLPDLSGGNNNDWTGYTENSDYVAMQKKSGDFLETKQVKVAEAWRYEGETRVDLEVHNTSIYNSKREIEGYNTLFIRGLDGNRSDINDPGIPLYEKEINGHKNQLELFVKYVIDKDGHTTGARDSGGLYELDLDDENYRVLNALRQLKIFDKDPSTGKAMTALEERSSKENEALQIKDLGIEGIAEINAFSTYYGDLATYSTFYNKRPQYKHYADKPAGTVDRDSNPSNIGEEPTVRSFITAVPTLASIWTPKFGPNPGEAAVYYEDDTFKTGVKFLLPSDSRRRTITGMTWDDTRNTIVDEDQAKAPTDKKQYGGNGIYAPDADGKLDAQANENIKNLYNELDSSNDDDNKFKQVIEGANDLSNNNYERKDFLINEVKTKLVEIVKLPIKDASGNITEMRYYEEPAKRAGRYKELEPDDPGYDAAPWLLGTSEIETRSGRQGETGKYQLTGFVPGYYIVRFFYGDETSPEMLTYNGQDYKSTQYATVKEDGVTGVESFTVSNGAIYDDELERVVYSGEKAYEDGKLKYVVTDFNDTSDDPIIIIDEAEALPPTLVEEYDKLLESLTAENRNDARDDEISRLNAIGYSEIMTNAKSEILKGISSKTQYIDEKNEYLVAKSGNPSDGIASSTKMLGDNMTTPIIVQTAERMNSLITEKTAMNAETVTFYVKPERVNVDSTSYSGREILEESERQARDDGKYTINNIDFGLVYRPEAQMTLDKEIENISITTSDNNKIMNVAFKDFVNDASNVVIDPLTGRMKRVVDLENSIGLDKLQYIFNDDAIPAQGFFYINIDDDILQGCTISVEYALRAENISEIDRISSNLDILRYKENITDSLLTKVGDEYVNIGSTNPFRFETTLNLTSDRTYYTGSKTAEKILYNKWFKIDPTYTSDGEYRRAEKTMTQNEKNKYYGSFLGGAYFTNKVLRTADGSEVIDTYVDLKIDKILDYVDNDLVFAQEKNTSLNHRWMPVTAEYLYEGDEYNGRWLKNIALTLQNNGYSYNAHGRVVDETGTDVNLSANDVFTILDKDEVSYEREIKYEDDPDQRDVISNLAVSVDDRLVDDGYTAPSFYGLTAGAHGLGLSLAGAIGTSYDQKEELNTTMQNASISRYLEPKIDPTLEAEVVHVKGEPSYYQTNKYNLNEHTHDQYAGKILITAERIISAETDMDNLAFENIAEVIQYSCTNGRRTNFKTTLGDAEVEKHRKLDENGDPTPDPDPDKPSTIYEESMISHKNDPDHPTDPTKSIKTPKDPDTTAVEIITLSPPTGLDRIQRVIRNVVNTTSRVVLPIGVGLSMAAIVIGTFAIVRSKKKKTIK